MFPSTSRSLCLQALVLTCGLLIPATTLALPQSGGVPSAIEERHSEERHVPERHGEEQRRAERRMAVTFDDLPAQSTVEETAVFEDITDGILAAAERFEMPLLGLANENKLMVGGKVDPLRVNVLKRWLDAGHNLGNHTYSHPDLHQIDVADFLEDISRGERVLGQLIESPEAAGDRFFRHPMLHTGRDLETKRAVELFLEGRGYRIAPVTIDNGEWIFARAFDLALDRRDSAAAGRVALEYIDYMVQVVAFYEDQARQILGYELPQILLLHANRLNARHGETLFEKFEARGYRFIRVEEALEDAAFSLPDTYVGSGGITWLHRWALTAKMDRSIFQGEPEVPAWVMTYSEL